MNIQFRLVYISECIASGFVNPPGRCPGFVLSFSLKECFRVVRRVEEV
jgi:hypothetical protein